MQETKFLTYLYQIVKTWFPKYDFLGHYRYCLVEISSIDNRVKLQAIKPQLGLPDILHIDIYPGLAGSFSQLTLSSTILVCFIEGDPKFPFVSHLSNFRDPGFVPVKTTIDASTEIKLGTNATSFVALANLVNTELTKIQATLLTGANTAGPVVFSAAYTASPVDATKVKAE